MQRAPYSPHHATCSMQRAPYNTTCGAQGEESKTAFADARHCTALRDSIMLAIGTVLPSTHRVAFAQVPQTAVSVGGGRDQVRRVGREDSLPHLPPCVSAQSTHVRTQITVRVLSRTRSPSHTTNGAEQRRRCNCTVITTTDGHRSALRAHSHCRVH